MNLRRGWWILGVVAVCALLAAGPAVASEGYYSNADGELTTSDLITYTAAGHGGPAADSPRIAGCCDPGVIGYAEYLHMGAKRDGLDVARIGNLNLANADSRLVEAQLGRDSGFRVGAGYQFATCWDATWTYTYFYTEGATALSAAAASPVSLTQSPLFGLVYGGNRPAGDFAFASNLIYHVNDFEVGRWIELDESASIRLFGGFRWAIIDQRLGQAWANVVAPGVGVGASLGNINMDGYGLRLGSEGRWTLPAGFSVFGKGAASVLAGHFDYNLAEVNTIGAGVRTLVARDSTTQVVPVFEAAVGVAWTYGNLEASAGYELNAWLNMANRYEIRDPAIGYDVSNATSNLLMDGFFVRLAFTR